LGRIVKRVYVASLPQAFVLDRRGIDLFVSAITLQPGVRCLGSERNGIWVAASPAVVMLAIIDTGATNSLTNPIFRPYAQGDWQFARRAYVSAISIPTVLPCLLASLARVLWLHIDRSSVCISATRWP